MMLQKRAIILLAFCILVFAFLMVFLALPASVSKDTAAYQSYSKSGYATEVSVSWDKMAEKNLGFSIPDFDFASMFGALVLGALVYGGIDIYTRRKTDHVIKRRFTHIQNK